LGEWLAFNESAMLSASGAIALNKVLWTIFKYYYCSNG